MPRNIRNFWASINVDGKATTMESGPVSKDGGLSITLLQRDNNDISNDALTVDCWVKRDGTTLHTEVSHGGKVVYAYDTQR